MVQCGGDVKATGESMATEHETRPAAAAAAAARIERPSLESNHRVADISQRHSRVDAEDVLGCLDDVMFSPRSSLASCSDYLCKVEDSTLISLDQGMMGMVGVATNGPTSKNNGYDISKRIDGSRHNAGSNSSNNGSKLSNGSESTRDSKNTHSSKNGDGLKYNGSVEQVVDRFAGDGGGDGYTDDESVDNLGDDEDKDTAIHDFEEEYQYRVSERDPSFLNFSDCHSDDEEEQE